MKPQYTVQSGVAEMCRMLSIRQERQCILKNLLVTASLRRSKIHRNRPHGLISRLSKSCGYLTERFPETQQVCSRSCKTLYTQA